MASSSPNKTVREIAKLLTDAKWESTKKLFDAQPALRNSLGQFLIDAAIDIEHARRILGESKETQINEYNNKENAH